MLILTSPVINVYFPQDGQIRVHQSRVCLCPQDFPAGYYWYGGKRKGPGCPPKWVDRLLKSGAAGSTPNMECSNDSVGPPQTTEDTALPHSSSAQDPGSEPDSSCSKSQESSCNMDNNCSSAGTRTELQCGALPDNVDPCRELEDRSSSDDQESAHSAYQHERDRRLRRVVKPPKRLM